MMCVVDSGIAFNSPFPPILRTDRGVELILSFDFSQKDGDDDPPFVVSTIVGVRVRVVLSPGRNPPPPKKKPGGLCYSGSDFLKSICLKNQ